MRAFTASVTSFLPSCSTLEVRQYVVIRLVYRHWKYTYCRNLTHPEEAQASNQPYQLRIMSEHSGFAHRPLPLSHGEHLDKQLPLPSYRIFSASPHRKYLHLAKCHVRI